MNLEELLENGSFSPLHMGKASKAKKRVPHEDYELMIKVIKIGINLDFPISKCHKLFLVNSKKKCCQVTFYKRIERLQRDGRLPKNLSELYKEGLSKNLKEYEGTILSLIKENKL